MKLGFVGLGNMGSHMVRHLINHGHDLVVFDVRKEAIAPFEKDVQVARSPKEVAANAEWVCVSLPTPAIVESVVLGEEGLLHGGQMKVYIDFSTTGQKMTQKLANVLEEKGIKPLDAPVSGGVPGAKAATLTIMVSGEHSLYQKALPIFEVLGKKIVFVGEKPGLSQTIKVINNLLSATNMAITSEAFVLGKKAGLDPSTMLEIINSSTGRNSASLDKFPTAVLNETYDYGFKTELMYKDLKMCLELAEDLQFPMFIGNTVRELWKFMISQEGGSSDMTEIVPFMEKWVR